MFLPSSALLQGPQTLAASTCWLLPIPQPELRYPPRLPREIGTGFWGKAEPENRQSFLRLGAGSSDDAGELPVPSRGPRSCTGARHERVVTLPSRLATSCRGRLCSILCIYKRELWDSQGCDN